MSFKITDSTWYTDLNGNCIGVVSGMTQPGGEKKFYIGLGTGLDERLDEKLIAENGSRFYPGIFKSESKPKMITLKQAAAIMDTTPGYLRVLVLRGQLKTAVKSGRDWVMDQEEAADLANKKRETSSLPRTDQTN